MFRYLYQPLQHKDSIRVLIVHPSLNQSGPISCTIHHTRLSDEFLNYEALSYAWGISSCTKTIEFKNAKGTLVIGDSCHNALRHLRRKHSNRFLWIDAICIDQADLTERTRQVRIMDRIFDMASGVVVYLGEQATECRALLQELAVVDEYMKYHGSEICRDGPNETIVKQLDAFFSLPWFKRVWVLQEVCAKEDVDFMYGSALVSFRAIRSLYFSYQRNTAVLTWPLALEWMLRPPGEYCTTHVTLWKHLFSSRQCLATDPRDRIFALKSLTGSGQADLENLIDYSKSVEECFTQLAIFLLPVLGLRLLLAAKHPHTLEMSSWTPDWSQNLPLHIGEAIRWIQPARKRQYDVRYMSQGKGQSFPELLVKGCRYATIVQKSQTFSFTDMEDSRYQMNNLFHALANLRVYADAASVTQGAEMTENLGREIVNSMLHLDGEKLHIKLCHYGPMPLPWMFKSNCDDEIVEGFYSRMQKSSIALLNNDELAIVPERAQHGDVVTIIAGAIEACILRQSEGNIWTLISGDCVLFTDRFRDHKWTEMFSSEEYIAQYMSDVEIFTLR